MNKYKHWASTKGKQHDKYKHVITNENPNLTTIEAVFHFFIFLNWDFDLDFRSFEIKKIYSHLKNVN